MTYLLLCLSIMVTSAVARDECTKDTLMDCVDVFNATDMQLKRAISSENFLERSKEICEPFITGTRCLEKISQCPNFAEYQWVPTIPEYLREFCEITNFTHGETYRIHKTCLERPADNSLQCLHEYIMEFPLVSSQKTSDSNKRCCTILKKLMCYRKTFPEACDGQNVRYDFMEKFIQTLKTSCADVTCYEFPESLDETIYNILENFTAKPEVSAFDNMSTTTLKTQVNSKPSTLEPVSNSITTTSEPPVNTSTVKQMSVGSSAAIFHLGDFIVLGQALSLAALFCRWSF